MDQAPQQRKGGPRAAAGKILLLNGAGLVGIAVLIGGYILVASSGTTATQESSLVTVARLIALIFGAIGIPLGLVGLVLWLLPEGTSPASGVVKQYYTALEHQDYAAAFQCLDPLRGDLLSEPLSQDHFIERIRAYDAEHGRVISHFLSGVQANPGSRQYYLKVARANGASYSNRVRVKKQGDEWKITGFDRF
jgi:hypothetical protein